MDRDDPDRFRFFATMKRAERERLERFCGEERKRFILRCGSTGMRHHSKLKPKVTLTKFSWEK